MTSLQSPISSPGDETRKKRRLFTLLPLLILILVGVIACQPEVVEVTKIVTEAQQVVVTQVVEVEGEVVMMEVAATAMPMGTPTVGPVNGSPGGAAGNEVASSDSGNVQAQTRLIIKDGNMNLVVRDTDAAAAQVVDLTLDMGGYVISQQIWSDERERRYASLQLGVPSDQFERAMGAFRTLGTVTQESASGQDVTDEYFDLNSHLGNLYATQEQLRTLPRPPFPRSRMSGNQAAPPQERWSTCKTRLKTQPIGRFTVQFRVAPGWSRPQCLPFSSGVWQAGLGVVLTNRLSQQQQRSVTNEKLLSDVDPGVGMVAACGLYPLFASSGNPHSTPRFCDSD